MTDTCPLYISRSLKLQLPLPLHAAQHLPIMQANDGISRFVHDHQGFDDKHNVCDDTHAMRVCKCALITLARTGSGLYG